MNKKSLKKALLILGFVLIPSIVLVLFISRFQGYIPLPTLSEKKFTPLLFSKDSSSLSADSLFDQKISLIQPFIVNDSIGLIAPVIGNIYGTVYQKFEMQPEFQIISMVPWELKEKVDSAYSLLPNVDPKKWKLVYIDSQSMQNSFKQWTEEAPIAWHLYIADKDGHLRGREENGKAQKSYNSLWIKVLRKEVGDDLKVLISEYSLAFKKYDKYKEK